MCHDATNPVWRKGRPKEKNTNNNNNNNNAQEVKASFAIANLHLPARPSNVLGRLNTMSKTIRKLGELDKAMKKDRPKTTKKHD
mmetsp:Transcript_17195/g.42896  ORF Transcript_17195/g.42896 Transcript_17195/m.42896 type:complete len:84 (-) Transcript_17195:3946-4197(-)